MESIIGVLIIAVLILAGWCWHTSVRVTDINLYIEHQARQAREKKQFTTGMSENGIG